VEHLSLWLDIKIFFKTIFKVFTNADNANVGKTVEDDKKEEQKEDNAQPIETLAEVAATVDKRADEQEVQAEE
jgi:hypothetical protein